MKRVHHHHQPPFHSSPRDQGPGYGARKDHVAMLRVEEQVSETIALCITNYSLKGVTLLER